ncbi:MAG: DUF2849 domain-containing protein [Alphaproteobacteria bacterium]
MFKTALAGTKKVVTANRLIDGIVIFVGPGPGWVTDIRRATVFNDGPDLDTALHFGAEQVTARQIVDPYAVDVDVEGGCPMPERLRERIRAVGPSVDYGEAERRRLDAARNG